jgi:hypothetical protein
MQKVVAQFLSHAALFTFLFSILSITYAVKNSLAGEEMGSCETDLDSVNESMIITSEGTVKEQPGGAFQEVLLVSESTVTEKENPQQNPIGGNCERRAVKTGDRAADGTMCNQGKTCIFPNKPCGAPGTPGRCVPIAISGDGVCDCKCVH